MDDSSFFLSLSLSLSSSSIGTMPMTDSMTTTTTNGLVIFSLQHSIEAQEIDHSSPPPLPGACRAQPARLAGRST
jgi:hypothetical protein